MRPELHSTNQQAADPPHSPGQAIVEFALASLLFLTIVFGTIDLGRAVFINSELDNAAREGARVGKIDPTDTAAIRQAVLDHSTASGLTGGGVTISCDGSCGAGDSLTVTTTVEFQAVTQNLLGISPVTLTSSATVDIE